jgi:hypothetical protein
MDLTDIYRVFHPTTAQYTLFSVVHGTFSKMDNILGHKVNFNKYKKIEITPSILSGHNAIKLELNTWRLSNTLLYDRWVIEDIRGDIKKFL